MSGLPPGRSRSPAPRYRGQHRCGAIDRRCHHCRRFHPARSDDRPSGPAEFVPEPDAESRPYGACEQRSEGDSADTEKAGNVAADDRTYHHTQHDQLLGRHHYPYCTMSTPVEAFNCSLLAMSLPAWSLPKPLPPSVEQVDAGRLPPSAPYARPAPALASGVRPARARARLVRCPGQSRLSVARSWQ